MEVIMKIRIVVLAVALFFAGFAKADTFEMKGFLVPASVECCVTISFEGAVLELNVMGDGKVEYDQTGRISEVGSSKISYDDTGRIEKIGTSVFEYDDTGRIEKIASASFSYDDSGRIKEIGVSKISYDDEGRVVGINPGIASSL